MGCNCNCQATVAERQERQRLADHLCQAVAIVARIHPDMTGVSLPAAPIKALCIFIAAHILPLGEQISEARRATECRHCQEWAARMDALLLTVTEGHAGPSYLPAIRAEIQRLAEQVLHRARSPTTCLVCSRTWRYLAPFASSGSYSAMK